MKLRRPDPVKAARQLDRQRAAHTDRERSAQADRENQSWVDLVAEAVSQIPGARTPLSHDAARAGIAISEAAHRIESAFRRNT